MNHSSKLQQVFKDYLRSATVPLIQGAFTVHIYGAVLTAKHLQKYTNAAPASSLTLTMGGMGENRAMEGYSILCAMSTSLRGLTRGLALDLRPLEVNAVSACPVDTPLWKAEGEGRRVMMEAIGKKKATGIVGQLGYVAHMYLNIMKDRNCSGPILDSNSGFYLV
jgi:NAD(P)-dependent dehydrogenase (short-subunit alcohol dehydrogenase family)